jgi:Double-GTPase 2
MQGTQTGYAVMSESRESSNRPEWRADWDDRPPRASGSRPSPQFLLFVLAGAIASIIVAVFVYLVSTSKISASFLWTVLGAVAGVAGIFTATIVTWLNQRTSVVPVRIAVLGLPQVGKTTLITACFQEIFSRRINIRAVMSGTRSFESLNDNIARLAAGAPLKPTSDQDVAAYRFEIAPSGWLTPRYRVEFGDFPGEDTEKYVEQYGPWLHKTPFFEWALTCDAFVFCVDSGRLSDIFKAQQGRIEDISPEAKSVRQVEALAYIAQTSAAVRTAWQHIVADFGPRRVTYARRSPLLLVFTKVDLLFRYGESEKAPKIVDVPEFWASDAQAFLMDQFSELIRYLGGETSQFHAVATSSFAASGGGDRLGINEFLHDILPKRAFVSGSA